jgi:putative exporter of polyketide antibiotics
MSWWQGVLTVFFGNVLTLVPMVLNAHPGTKYGVRAVPAAAAARMHWQLGSCIGISCKTSLQCTWAALLSAAAAVLLGCMPEPTRTCLSFKCQVMAAHASLQLQKQRVSHRTECDSKLV